MATNADVLLVPTISARDLASEETAPGVRTVTVFSSVISCTRVTDVVNVLCDRAMRSCRGPNSSTRSRLILRVGFVTWSPSTAAEWQQLTSSCKHFSHNSQHALHAWLQLSYSADDITQPVSHIVYSYDICLHGSARPLSDFRTYVRNNVYISSWVWHCSLCQCTVSQHDRDWYIIVAYCLWYIRAFVPSRGVWWLFNPGWLTRDVVVIFCKLGKRLSLQRCP